MEFPHVLDISVLYTCNLQLLFVSYYKIVTYLSNQSKDQALSVNTVMAEIKSKLKIIILKHKICMHKLVMAEIKSKLKIIIFKYKICKHKLSFSYVCQESRYDFSCYQNILSENFLIKIPPF